MGRKQEFDVFIRRRRRLQALERLSWEDKTSSVHQIVPLSSRLSTVHNGLGETATILFAIVKMTVRFS